MNKHSSQTLRMLMALMLAVCASGSLKAQLQVEYFFDSDPGFGLGKCMEASPDADGNFSFSALTTGLEPGRHLLGFRIFKPGNPDATVERDKSTHYAPTVLQHIFVSKSETPFVSYVEYFWDVDPGTGKATKLDITAGNEVNLDNIAIPTTGLSKGHHLLGIRAYGERGWSPLITQDIYVPADTSEGNDVRYVEYFWDVDPGFGKGKSLSFTNGQEVNIDNLTVSTEGLTPGNHKLYIRAYGNNGWSPTTSHIVYVEPDVSDFKVLEAEYFWNDDPGFGKGTPITLTPGQEVSISNFKVPTDVVQGDAVLFVRYRGNMGWSPTVAYPVMVNANGSYTLNSSQTTSLADRIYQNLPDAFYDFDDRGISDKITLNMGSKNQTYELDATDDNRLSQIARLAENLNEISDARDHKIIAFSGTSSGTGSGNKITVTTTEAGLPTVISLFAQTSQTNVPLTINGTAYNFTPASMRCQVGCSNTTSVPLSTISEAVKATWKALPHEGTTLSGFTTEGEGDIPEMTIVNSGVKTDSIAYLVTLSTQEGQKLCDYTYYIYVYAPMQNQKFTDLTPVTGSSVDPVATKLTWNTFNDATGYRIVVSEAAAGGDPKEIVNKVVTATEYEITVKTGYTYTWTVTAIGHCDELTSQAMTLQGRLLPDLIVESINLPEAAPAGTELTVTAIIKNQGTGATTEGEWTDRLYYTINSTKWADRVQITDVVHEGNVAVDGSYEVSFNMIVPDVESGTLRVFVEINTNLSAMEANTGNNYKISSTTATMTPVYVNAEDRSVLCKLYDDFGGSEWNGTKWNISSELISGSNWSGVTFDADGRVKAINLQARGLSGSMSTATPLTLPKLTTLNLSRNALTGDPSKYINKGTTPLLTTVDLGYNQIDELGEALPKALTVTLKSQHRKYNANGTLPGLDNMSAQTLNVGNRMEVEVPRIVGYNHSAQTFDNIQTLKVYKRDNMGQLLGNLKWSSTYKKYYYEGYVGHPTQPQVQDDDVVLVPSGGSLENSAYPAKFHMVLGDADLTGFVDVIDVQCTLNRILNTGSGTFSLWAANTWDDDIINIQDIVCTVNIVLENQGDQLTSRRRTRQADAANIFYASGRNICLSAQDEIAAFDLKLEGVNSSQIRLMLNSTDWQMQTRDTDYGVRLVVFSPTGQTLPLGATEVLRMSADGMPVDVQATSINAEEVMAGVASNSTGITVLEQDGGNGYIYDLHGRKVKENSNSKATRIYIKNGKKVMKSWK